MSVKSAPYYWLECDEEGCGVKSTEGSDYTAFGDPDDAESYAHDSDWATVTEPDGSETHYCEEHRKNRVCGECGEPAGDGAAEREGMCPRCWVDANADATRAVAAPVVP